MVCVRCGHSNEEGAAVCEKCGGVLTESRAQAGITIDIETHAMRTEADDKLRETRKFIAVIIALGVIITLGLIVLTFYTFS